MTVTSEHADPESSPAAEPSLDGAMNEDGIDLTLIRWSLSLSPLERLEAAQSLVDLAWAARNSGTRQPLSKLDYLALMRRLTEAKIEFAVVGGVASILNGAPVTTFDWTLCTERQRSESQEPTLDQLSRLFFASPAATSAHSRQFALS